MQIVRFCHCIFKIEHLLYQKNYLIYLIKIMVKTYSFRKWLLKITSKVGIDQIYYLYIRTFDIFTIGIYNLVLSQ